MSREKGLSLKEPLLLHTKQRVVSGFMGHCCGACFLGIDHFYAQSHAKYSAACEKVKEQDQCERLEQKKWLQATDEWKQLMKKRRKNEQL